MVSTCSVVHLICKDRKEPVPLQQDETTTFHEDSLLCDRVRPLFLGLCDLVCIDYFHSPYVKVQFKYDSTGLKEKIHRMETVRSFWDCSVLVFL